MSYEDKISAARSIVERHNNEVSEDSTKIDFDAFVAQLKGFGGTTESALSQAKWEDLEGCGLPRLMARQVSSVFRESPRSRDRIKSGYVKASHAKAMTLDQLIGVYDPRDRKSNVSQILAERTDDKPFIVFEADGSVNVEVSAKLANEIADGHEPRDKVFTRDGKPVRVYSVGERPDQLADQNPLFEEALRPDATCSQTGRSWESVPHEVRQIIYLAKTDTGEIVLSTSKDAHDVLDLVAFGDDKLVKVRQRYPEASMRLDELRAQSNEPSLKRKLASSEKPSNNDPFYSGHRAY